MGSFLYRLLLFFALFSFFTGTAYAQECPAESNFVNCYPTYYQEQYGFQVPEQMNRVECTRNDQPYVCAVGSQLTVEGQVSACPDTVTNGLNALPYSQRSNPGPISRGFSLCTYEGQLHSFCPGGKYMSGGYCISLEGWVSAQSTCCSADQASCTLPDNVSGVCSNQSLNTIACESGRACQAVDLGDVSDGDPGSFYCNCTNNGANWVCNPGQNPGSFGTNPLTCASWATPDVGRCSPNLPSNRLPDFCDRSDGGRCGGELVCISVIDESGQEKKSHGEDCTYSPNNDECDDSVGLQCTTVDGDYKCAFPPGTRGGVGVPGSQSSCLWEFECIDAIGIDTGPENEFECRNASSGQLCDPSRHQSCSCVPPEGTWVGGEEVSASSEPFALCAQVDEDSRGVCEDCVDGTTLGAGNQGIWTSLGCIPSDGRQTIRHLIVVGLGLAGGVGLLMIIAAGALFTLSKNDPKKVGDAKELLSSVVIGLLFIAFSVTVLQFIGVTILKIPGFGGM